MLAIHNSCYYISIFSIVANAYAKLSKCQQFTTSVLDKRARGLLQTLLQSYQNVSNSQLHQLHHTYTLCCKRLCKVIKMLAIHNLEGAQLPRSGLQTLMQSYQNVSNSQHLNIHTFHLLSCKRLCKVIKMLAIHNSSISNNFHVVVANAYAKLSKCQQFTTAQDAVSRKKWLQTLMQSYQNVSNSQPRFLIVASALCCKRLCKVIKMLAIHNYYAKMLIIIKVANAYAKLSKCQQFTTRTCRS